MFLWTTPFGLKTFNMTPEVAASSAVLAANQGLYNGFLAAGLVWGSSPRPMRPPSRSSSSAAS
jgi:putative membrane protein